MNKLLSTLEPIIITVLLAFICVSPFIPTIINEVNPTYETITFTVLDDHAYYTVLGEVMDVEVVGKVEHEHWIKGNEADWTKGCTYEVTKKNGKTYEVKEVK